MSLIPIGNGAVPIVVWIDLHRFVDRGIRDLIAICGGRPLRVSRPVSLSH
jgi:hypothetical protein